MKKYLDFTDYRIVITGATRGIGFAIAHKFLSHGAKVAIFGSRAETVSHALRELKSEFKGQQILGFHPKLDDPSELASVMSNIAEQFGGIDILINNAGVASKTRLEDYTVEEYTKITDLNIKAILLATQAALPYLRKSPFPAILNTSSMVATYGQPSGVLYPASKFAVNGLTKSLARELAPSHIRVNAVAPGVIETDMVKQLPNELIAPLVASIPLGRIGQPEDIANAFLFLASPLASYISGAVLPVDGLARS